MLFGINRTFMELKHFRKTFTYCRKYSINRTFMELKLSRCNHDININVVLIEPLWNWNRRVDDVFTYDSRINRTFMELKL